MRTENEMQITLARLRDEFSVDVAPALELHGQALAAWLDQAEDELFEREHAELRAQHTYRTRPADDGGFYFLSGAGKPTEDELAGMTWWNGLPEYERTRWMGFAGNTGKVADAWAEWKRCVPTFLDDDGPLADIPNLITKPRR